MAQDKKSFILYSDQKGVFNQLPDEIAGRLIKHIFSYVNDENPTTDDLIINIAFEPIKLQLKRDLKKWDTYIEKQRENGKKGGRPKNPIKAKKPKPFFENPDKPKKADNVNDNVNVNVNDNVKVNNNIEYRKAEFKNSLHSLFSNENDLNDFYLYWTEHGINDKKMRFEKEKSFGLERRVATWMRNKEKFNNNNQKNGKELTAVEKLNNALLNYGKQ